MRSSDRHCCGTTKERPPRPRRSQERVGASRLTEIAGNPALTGFQAPKILWLREEEPTAYERVASVLLPKDYVRLRLTGERATDASDASGTLLLDLKERTWSGEILDALEIPVGWLPRVFEGPDRTGQVRQNMASDLGLRTSVAGGGWWRRQRCGRDWQRHHSRWIGQLLDRHEWRAVRTFGHAGARSVRSTSCLLSRSARSVSLDGRDALRGWGAALVA